ncbi:MAG: hypothetical protein R2716_12600 [Microthrixaceae bacterium]
MPEIGDPSLSVDAVEGHPGKRRIRVAYDLVVEASDPVAGRTLDQRISLRAVDEHDAAIRPRQDPVAVIEATVRADVGTHAQVSEAVVDRVDLDVEQDDWRSTPGGDVPIAEWLDHLIAEIALSDGSSVVASATTPVVTGSWGPLGSD